MKLRPFLEITLGVVLLTGFCMGLVLVVGVPFELYQMTVARTWPSRKGVRCLKLA